MQLYLLRHADAETEAPTDEERFLSEKGQNQALRVARFCAARSIIPSVLLSSPLRRAHQTAQAIAETLKLEINTVDWLACGAEPERVVRELETYDNCPSVMIVGHEPDFSRLCGYMLSMPAELIRIRRASLTSLEVFSFEPIGARLDFLVPAKLTHPFPNVQ